MAVEDLTIPKRLREIATRLANEWPGEFDNWATWITIAATRIECLEWALKDTVSTACENARQRDSWQHMHGVVEAELTANERMVDGLQEALRWALAELNGTTRYDNDEQRENAFAKAEAALAWMEGQA